MANLRPDLRLSPKLPAVMSEIWGKAEVNSMRGEVREGSTPELGNHLCEVRLAPESGSRETPVPLPLCAAAITGHSMTAYNLVDRIRLPEPSTGAEVLRNPQFEMDSNVCFHS
jgi:hypothetical protein